MFFTHICMYKNVQIFMIVCTFFYSIIILANTQLKIVVKAVDEDERLLLSAFVVLCVSSSLLSLSFKQSVPDSQGIGPVGTSTISDVW